MLVLTRKLQEKITIAGNITVTVLRVKGQTVRIGIEAPREIRVVRGELPMEAMAGEATATEAAIGTAAEAVCDVAPAAKRNTAAGKSMPEFSSASRLPQRRKFDRYSQPPLKRAVASTVALAK
jgi:carbon storage regulator CsrA